ncbi:DeoR family transcriptional regulator [Paramesorhizobium deserti]|uniref:DeoR family transcriptional regulator n=1 Tax=Paramesorhizobium deserti TaxID=1494590 RepID=A0A135HSY0_9HYPH|nr:DeoR/GlpR family DNA-binding transcription regulator [Paramesorhizobium deserti]KXF76298.1 DeoR family transcriptional regulator [Paramesorhizobium deserti]
MNASDFLVQERQVRIREKLATSGRVLAGDLALEFSVSEDTIRRDLREMAAAGLCRRVYGGALAPVPPTAPFMERAAEQPERKHSLARAAVQFIEQGMLVFLDASSTNLAIAREISSISGITVATNAPLIASALMDKVDLILIGGTVDRRVGAAVGGKALSDVALLRPDLCILGACGVEAQAGITAFHLEDAELKRVIARRSRSVMTTATAEKLGTAAPHDVIAMAECGRLVVEQDTAAETIRDIEALGVEVIFAA